MGELKRFGTEWRDLNIVSSDVFDIHDDPSLMPILYNRPAEYPPVTSKRLTQEQMNELVDRDTGEYDQEKVIPHLRDFVVEYINSDVLVSTSLRGMLIENSNCPQGLLSDIHLTRADQSSVCELPSQRILTFKCFVSGRYF